MSMDVFALTLRQVLGKRRTLALVAVAALPLLIAFVYRASDKQTEPVDFAIHLFRGFIVTTILPLVTLVFSTTALGQEVEDGTIVYLLAKPLARARIILAKLAASALPAALIVALSTLFSTAVGLQGTGEASIPLALAAAAILGAACYTCVFLLLSLMTSRALIVGLVYVFLWEGVITNLFSGTRVFSVREYTLGIADALTSTRALDAHLGPIMAVALLAAVAAGAVALAVRKLTRFEMRGQM